MGASSTMLCQWLIILFALGAPVAPANVRRDDYHVLHERRGLSGAEWAKGPRASAHSIIPVRIGLTQRNLDLGPDLLYEVSDPKSARYGKHYTDDEIIDLFAPSSDTVQAVQEWIESAGIPNQNISLSTNKQWLQFDAKIHELESILKTEFHLHKHAISGKLHAACDEYYVPEAIQHHVDYITPGIKLLDLSPLNTPSLEQRDSIVSKEKSHKLPIISKPLPIPVTQILAEPLATKCGKGITPACIRALYNFTIGTTAHPKNALGIFESDNSYYGQEDLNRFFTKLFPELPNGTHPRAESIDGSKQFPNAAPSTEGIESQLDFEIAMPIVYPQTTVVYQSGDEESETMYPGIFNTFLDAIDGSYCSYCAYGECGDKKGWDAPYPDPAAGGYKGKLQCGNHRPTNVISISYGGPEFYTPLNYQRRMCNEFMKLGMQGISVVFASGDTGFAGGHTFNDNGCLFADQDNHNFVASTQKTVANPNTPQSCPWVTVVGGTYLPKGADPYEDAELTTTEFPSGAGFSNIFGVPDYQQAAVAEYFTLFDPPFPSYNSTLNNSFAAGGGLYNRIGRAYPDVSANGQNILLSVYNNFSLHGGTSAAAPIFAGLLTRINEERLYANKSRIGFVNPVLYANPQVLNDNAEGADGGCVDISFNATTGWDPVYGLGTPDFGRMLDLFMSLP